MTFTVYGLPQPAGSKRAFPIRRRDGSVGVNVSDSNPKAKGWKNQVADAARAVGSAPILEGPVSLLVVFLLPRPKGHHGKRGVRKSAPTAPTVKPDLLKLARAVEDALTGIAYRDDSQIVLETLMKRYALDGVAATVITVTETETGE